jgi:peptidoglycan/LPS O-acetylase OafA/YrhL
VSISQRGGGFLIELFPRRANLWTVQLGDYAGFLWRNFNHGDSWQHFQIRAGAAFVLAAAGVWVAFRSQPRRALALMAFVLSAGLGAVLYFNRPESYFRSLDRHYLPSLVALAVPAAGQNAGVAAARVLRHHSGDRVDPGAREARPVAHALRRNLGP